MSAADRTRRQSAADHAGRESRIEAVTRDLHAVAVYKGCGHPAESRLGDSHER